MFFINATSNFPLFYPYICCIWLGIVCKPFCSSLKYKKYSESRKNCCLRHLSIRYRQMSKEKTFLWQKSYQLQEWLSKIDDRMTEIENLKDEIMSFKEMIDDNNLEITKSFTNNFILVYYFIFSDETFTSLIYPTKSNKLLAFAKLFV